ncbi:MAG: ATP-binding protein [Acidobacteriota bacterium]
MRLASHNHHQISSPCWHASCHTRRRRKFDEVHDASKLLDGGRRSQFSGSGGRSGKRHLPHSHRANPASVDTGAGSDQSRVEAASVAVVEACLNAMEHGGGPVVVRLRSATEAERACLAVEVEDHGQGFDPERAPRNRPSRVLGRSTKRGWGLTLIRELMDEVHIQSAPGKTLVYMRKYVESAP